jgi:hypothetical protein
MALKIKNLYTRRLNRIRGKVSGYMRLKYKVNITKNEKRLRDLKNIYKGRRGFILGNGPSLNKIDLGLLKNQITIGCNGIFLITDQMGFMPTFYTVEDTLVAEDRAKDINRICGTHKIIPYDLRHWLKPDDCTIYVNFKRNYNAFPKFSTCFDAKVYWGGTVTFLNMQLAYYLGLKEIYLIGMDHTYKIPGIDKKKGAVITSQSDDQNHFHPDYFGPGYRYHDPMVERMEKGYLKAKEFFERDDRAIFNATAGGNLEVFPRVPFENVIVSN